MKWANSKSYTPKMPTNFFGNLYLLFVLYIFSCCLEMHAQQHLQSQNISPTDLTALQQINNCLTDIPSISSKFFSTWNFSSTDPCSTFSGVTCSPFLINPRRVIALQLGTGLSDSLGLAGSLPAAISELTELTQLILYDGIVTGSIPSEIGNLKSLRVISLTNNRLTGSIPASIFKIPNLHTLDLSNNQLSGWIPPTISNLSQLKVLVLASNKFSGELPPNLPPQLLHLDMKNNGLWGTLPTSTMPVSLRYLSISGNNMWGPLNGLESHSDLVYLDLSMNKFNGTIPSSLFRSTLSSMLLQRNNFSGGIPQESISPTNPYSQGSIVDLSHNMLTGEISNILLGVETIFLNNNRFFGKVPEEYVEQIMNGNTKTLYLQHNYITEFPLDSGMALPDTVAICFKYNCMVPPIELVTCPVSAGEELSRPAYQCSKFNNGSITG